MADDGLERLQVLGRVAVELNVGDMARVRERVVRRLDLYLVERADVVAHRHVEAVRVVVAVGDALDGAVARAVHAHEAAGQALGGRGYQAVVHLALGRQAVQVAAHVPDDLEP